jgi:hypothetical protein
MPQQPARNNHLKFGVIEPASLRRWHVAGIPDLAPAFWNGDFTA